MCLRGHCQFLYWLLNLLKDQIAKQDFIPIRLLQSLPLQIRVEVFDKGKRSSWCTYLLFMSAISWRPDQRSERQSLLKLDRSKFERKRLEQLAQWNASDNTTSTICKDHLVLTTTKIESVHSSGGKEHDKLMNTYKMRHKKIWYTVSWDQQQYAHRLKFPNYNNNDNTNNHNIIHDNKF